MTNPPFYKSDAEMAERAAEKLLPPLTACTGAPVEMVTPGGEVAFVGRILDESLQLRGRIQWYTAMFGFLSSVVALVQRLREHEVDNFAVSEFVQGKKTKRWAVAWSFRGMRPLHAIARGATTGSLKGSLPPGTEMLAVEFPSFRATSRFTTGLQEVIASLDAIHWEWDTVKLQGTLKTADKVWTRAWRRQKQREMDVTTESRVTRSEQNHCFRINIYFNLASVVVRCRWIEGHDEAAFTSFNGYVKTTAKAIYGRLADSIEKDEA